MGKSGRKACGGWSCGEKAIDFVGERINKMLIIVGLTMMAANAIINTWLINQGKSKTGERDMYKFLNELLKSGLTQNEITLLVEAAYKPFNREELLKKGSRVAIEGTYSAAALTRTIKKLVNKGLLKERQNESKLYWLSDEWGAIDFLGYEEIILSIVRSRVITLNTMKAAFFLLIHGNKVCSARYLAYGLGMDPDYVANTILARMKIIGLISTYKLSNDDKVSEEDNILISSGEMLMGFKVDISWNGVAKERWL